MANDHAAEERTLFGHPRALYVLFFAEMWERFSYYGMRALLMLYMLRYLQMSNAQAGGIYGDYTGLVYLTPLIGGFLADRYIGLRRSIILGGTIMAIGQALMAVDDRQLPAHPYLYAGLLALIIGNGFFKPNISTLVGQLYKPGDPRRDGGFTIFYMGINAGAFLSPLICGWVGQKTWGQVKDMWVGKLLKPIVTLTLGGRELTDAYELWHVGFALACIGMILGLSVFWFGAKAYLGDKGLKPVGPQKHDASHPAMAALSPREIGILVGIGVVGLGAAIASAWFTLYPRELGGQMADLGGQPAALMFVRAMLWPIAGTVVVAIFTFLMLRCQGDERTRVGSIFTLGLFVMVFWAAFEQAGSSLTIFADEKTRLSLFGVDFESSMFQSVNPLCIIIFAPAFSALWTWLAVHGKDPSTPIKMMIGITLECAAFALMIAAAKAAAEGVKISPLWLIGSYYIQTCGELCLSPIGLSMVTKLAPARFAAMLMGVWFLANAFANKLAGVGAEKIESMSPSGLFTFITVTLGVAAVLLLLITPVLRRWMAGVK